MVRTYAIVVDGKVINTVLKDDESDLDLTKRGIPVDVTDIQCGINWTYDGQTFTQPVSILSRREIISQLESIDFKSIRALREGNQELIQQYEQEAQELRQMLQQAQ